MLTFHRNQHAKLAKLGAAVQKYHIFIAREEERVRAFFILSIESK